MLKMKKSRRYLTGIVSIILFAVSPLSLLPGGAKTVYLPDNINVEENAFKTTPIGNTSDIIYSILGICIVDDYIYLLDYKNYSVVKLSFQGKVAARFGRKGEGPGEILRLSGIASFGDNIAIVDMYKVIICDTDLKFLREIKLKQRFHDIILTTDNNIYFYNNPSYYNYYFTIYSKDFKYLKKFGIKKPGAKEIDEKKLNFKNYRYSRDIVWQTLYVPEENGIWVSFRDRHDLRYYKDEKVVVNIKPKVQMYSSKEDFFSGVKVKSYTDYSHHIAKHENQLYHFYVIKDTLFCDMFDLSANYRLIRRLESPSLYYPIAHAKDAVFYGFRYDKELESRILDKIQIKKRRKPNVNLKKTR